MHGERFDVVVIGGGLIGLSTALMLSDRGADVTIVDHGELGGRPLIGRVRRLENDGGGRRGRDRTGHGWRSQFVSATLPLDPLAPDGGRSTVRT
jgi:glycine/D-amino acid oxidase-like deaminating enzyme